MPFLAPTSFKLEGSSLVGSYDLPRRSKTILEMPVKQGESIYYYNNIITIITINITII